MRQFDKEGGRIVIRGARDSHRKQKSNNQKILTVRRWGNEWDAYLLQRARRPVHLKEETKTAKIAFDFVGQIRLRLASSNDHLGDETPPKRERTPRGKPREENCKSKSTGRTP